MYYVPAATAADCGYSHRKRNTTSTIAVPIEITFQVTMLLCSGCSVAESSGIDASRTFACIRNSSGGAACACVREITCRVKFFNGYMSMPPGTEKRGAPEAGGRVFVLSFG
jgi:hypothetical protein